MEVLTRRSMQILRILYKKGRATNIYTLNVKQEELAKELGISRQALNVHLRKLRDLKYIRTGRGFIDVTEKGLASLGISAIPAFVFVKVSPHKRLYVYEKVKEFLVQKAFRITGDVDALLIVDPEKLDEVLKSLSSIEGIQDTKSYVAIETIK